MFHVASLVLKVQNSKIYSAENYSFFSKFSIYSTIFILQFVLRILRIFHHCFPFQPSDCQKLIEYLCDCTEEELLAQLKQINIWYFGKVICCAILLPHIDLLVKFLY